MVQGPREFSRIRWLAFGRVPCALGRGPLLPRHPDFHPIFMEIGLDLFDGVRSIVGD
jgi:hypothetical protein